MMTEVTGFLFRTSIIYMTTSFVTMINYIIYKDQDHYSLQHFTHV